MVGRTRNSTEVSNARNNDRAHTGLIDVVANCDGPKRPGRGEAQRASAPPPIRERFLKQSFMAADVPALGRPFGDVRDSQASLNPWRASSFQLPSCFCQI